MVGFEGKKLPQGDVRSAESASDIECIGGAFKNWLFWALVHLNTERNDALHDAINATHCVGQGARYIQLADSIRKFDKSPIGSALSASNDDYPDVAASIQSIFLGANGCSAAHGVSSAINTSGTTVVVKDARDEEKEVTTRQGQAHMALFNIGSKIDVEAGKVTDLTYGVPSTVIEGINAMLRASRAGQFAQASTRATGRPKIMTG